MRQPTTVQNDLKVIAYFTLAGSSLSIGGYWGFYILASKIGGAQGEAINRYVTAHNCTVTDNYFTWWSSYDVDCPKGVNEEAVKKGADQASRAVDDSPYIEEGKQGSLPATLIGAGVGAVAGIVFVLGRRFGLWQSSQTAGSANNDAEETMQLIPADTTSINQTPAA